MPNDTRSNAVRKAPPVDDDWMSVSDAADRLGCAVQTVYNRALRNELEHIRFAKRLFISRASVERALAGA